MIAIKGFEMPTSCYECPLWENETLIGMVCKASRKRRFTVERVYFAKRRHGWCPLVEVPEGRKDSR